MTRPLSRSTGSVALAGMNLTGMIRTSPCRYMMFSPDFELKIAVPLPDCSVSREGVPLLRSELGRDERRRSRKRKPAGESLRPDAAFVRIAGPGQFAARERRREAGVHRRDIFVAGHHCFSVFFA